MSGPKAEKAGERPALSTYAAASRYDQPPIPPRALGVLSDVPFFALYRFIGVQRHAIVNSATTDHRTAFVSWV